MFDRMRRRRASGRVRPGDEWAMQPFRGWQLLGRALFHLPLSGSGTPDWSVDIRHWQNQASGSVVADLYRNEMCEAHSALPAACPVDGGDIEVAMSGFGVKRWHFVAADGRERQRSPDPRSGEGRRARFGRSTPSGKFFDRHRLDRSRTHRSRLARVLRRRIGVADSVDRRINRCHLCTSGPSGVADDRPDRRRSGGKHGTCVETALLLAARCRRQLICDLFSPYQRPGRYR